MSRRRRSKREDGVGAEAGAGAGVVPVAAVAIVGHPPTVEREKVGARGGGSKIGHI